MRTTNFTNILSLCFCTLIGTWRTAHGQEPVVFNPDNGHYYQAVPGNLPWTVARDSAAAMTYAGLQGHLATVATPFENDFIYTTIYTPSFTNYPGLTFKGDWVWLGGYQPPGSAEPDGGWSWVTGESFNYANWDYNQPSNSEGVPQDYLLIWSGGGWNDAAGPYRGNDVSGFIVEFEGVPEPGILSLSVCGGIFWLWRRFSFAALKQTR